MNMHINDNKGIAALLTIIIIGAAALLLAFNASLLGLGELDQGYTSQKGGQAESVAEGCLEETLRRIRLDTNYGVGAGSIGLSIGEDSCILTVTDLGGARRITVTGTSDSYNSKLEAELSLSGNVITLTSWEEKTD